MINSAAHYWLVGNKTGQVFSSAMPGYVATSNATYAAWIAAGNAPSTVLCDGELADVLLKAGLPNAIIAACGATSLGNLPAADAVAVKLACGVVVTSTATGDLDGTYACDVPAQQNIGSVAQYVSTFKAYPAAQITLSWQDIAGGAHAFPADIASAGTFLAFARAVADYCAAVINQAAVLAAGGTPAWPTSAISIP